MAEESIGGSSRAWKSATALAVLAALLVAGWGYSESYRAQALQAALDTANQRIEQANAALREASKRDLPVSVTFRPALLGSGLVATFKNNSSRTLEVAAVFSSPNTGQQRQANLVLPSSGVQEIGHSDGWPFTSGQHITLTNTDFRPVEYIVPGS
jgi:hypothetical protein